MSEPIKTKVVAPIAGGLILVFALAAPLIQRWEGVKYTPYRDSVGVLTVCYGSTRNVDPKRTYSRAECEARLDVDMRIANADVRRCLPMPMLPQIEAALTSAVFNVGPKVVCGSTLQRHALANDWPAACRALDSWKYAGGRVLRGLVLRRSDEKALCQGHP